ncbi:hypothetical protein RGQ29_018809 [Quercus rubra]|uniref:Uncharacterized protein n=1 Tax=Quercus rubra TaxID=3512 RepID=A0AAN7IS82_QUERU|nr:hypothetical protein RGQ29_018809 [Quercus rubra]
MPPHHLFFFIGTLCVRSLCYQEAEGAFRGSPLLPHFELQKPTRRNPRLLTLNTTQGWRIQTMSEAISYNSNSSQHSCDMDQCMVRTSLKLHNFGRRFYDRRHWKPDSGQHCKSFKWMDGNTCRRVKHHQL